MAQKEPPSTYLQDPNNGSTANQELKQPSTDMVSITIVYVPSIIMFTDYNYTNLRSNIHQTTTTNCISSNLKLAISMHDCSLRYLFTSDVYKIPAILLGMRRGFALTTNPHNHSKKVEIGITHSSWPCINFTE